MRTRNINRQVDRKRDVLPMELQRWKRFVDGLPDPRSGELEASRTAPTGDRYDYEAILDETARRIFNEISHHPPTPRGAP